jgi:hypothetical protein
MSGGLNGAMECWSNGVMGTQLTPLFYGSNSPLIQYSITPIPPHLPYA